MNRRSLARKQSKILKSIHDCKLSTAQELTGILKQLRYYSDSDVAAFGGVAYKLKKFVDQIDVDDPHPDLFSIFDGALVSDDSMSFNRIAADCLRLCFYGLNFNMSQEVIKTLRNLFWKHPLVEVLDQQLDESFRKKHLRFLPDRHRRDALRAQMYSGVVSLGELYTAGVSMWQAAPCSFDGFHRFDSKFSKDIEQTQVRLEHFRSLNLPSLASEIEKSLNSLKARENEDRYYGFHKIKLTEAAIILGRMHGYKFFEAGPEATTGWGNMLQARNGRYTYASLDVFGSYQFYVFDSGIYDVRVEYWPRIYTHLELQDLTSDRMRQVIELLEAYPAANNKPLFDRYLVLVPGLNYPYRIFGTTMKLRRVNGEVIEFVDESPEQAHRIFDQELIKSKLITPILLGERDGEYYFISYFI